MSFFAASHPDSLSELPAKPEALSQLQLVVVCDALTPLANEGAYFQSFQSQYENLMQ